MKIEEMISKNRADCTGCSACKNICPKSCITMDRDDEGFLYPTINHDECINCGRCESVCPSLNFKATMPTALPDVFAAVYPNDKVRRHSSSGGAFTALSELILNDGGIIFGAGFDENWRVVHTAAENLDELENLRGSKYVQSEIGDVYKRVKVELEKDRLVLFSGTPCQCAGLKSFLGKYYPKLLTIDIICHGTPSPMLWEKYLEHRAQSHDIAHVNFRSKRFGWASNLEINFYDCGYYLGNSQNNFYLNEFLNDLINRPSCHECKFKFPDGKSDLTLGDAWGIQNFAPEVFDNKGTSLVIVHTYQGRKFLAKTTLSGKPVSFDIMPIYNPCFLTSITPDARRQNFFDDIKKSPDMSVAVMKKYFYENPNGVGVEGRNLVAEAMQKYVAVSQDIAKLRAKNHLLIIPPQENLDTEILIEDMVSLVKDSGIYIIQVQINGEMVFWDYMHPIIQFAFQDDLNTLKKLFNDFNITEIVVDEHIQFDEETEQWLKDAELPVTKFIWNRV